MKLIVIPSRVVVAPLAVRVYFAILFEVNILYSTVGAICQIPYLGA